MLRWRLSLLLLLVCAAGADGPRVEKHSFSAEKYGFSVSYPTGFTPIEVPASMVALALRHDDSSYPTFNVVIQAGRYDPLRSSPAAQEQEILESYRKVGLTAIKPRKSGILTLPAGRAFQALLEYDPDGGGMTAVVTILSARNMHYILTWLDESSAFETNREALAQILDSFELTQPPVEASSQSPQKTGLLSIVVWAIAIGLIILVMGWRLNSRK